MRVLRLRFKNLSSLKGSWEIDLTHPAYTSEGLFAITGPTGAGKSTVFDALCLALYGRTPRLRSLSKDSNDIMTRGTGDCAAEVEFDCLAGRFRCSWSQARARNKPDGKLQPAKHELSLLDSGEILTSKLRDTEKAVEERVGMTFERFTRSMMLAQGSFAAFLQADGTERGALLEQISGSEIYRKISETTYLRFKEEEQKRTRLHEEAGVLKTLDDNERQETEQELTALRQQEDKHAALLAQTQAALHWRQKLQQLHADLIHSEEHLGHAQKEHEAQAPLRLQLQRDAQAQTLIADVRLLDGLRQQQQAEQQAYQTLQEALPSLLQHKEDAQTAEDRARHALTSQKEALPQQQQLWKQVRALDLRRDSLGQTLAEQRQACDKTRAERETVHSAQDASRLRLQEYRAELEKEQAAQDAARDDASLPAALAGLDQQLEALCQAGERMHQQRQALQKQEDDIKKLNTTQKANEAAWNLLCEEQQQTKNHLHAHLAAWKALSQDLPLPTWHQRLSEERQRDADWKRLSELRQQWQENHDESLSLTQRLSDAHRDRATCHNTVEATATALHLAETLERQLGLRAYRADLHDHAPCPLCGALDHPYHRQPPDSDEISPEQVAERLTAARRAAKEAEKALAHLDALAQQTAEQLARVQPKEQRAAQAVAERWAVVSTEPLPPSADWATVFAVGSARQQQSLDTLSRHLQRLEEQDALVQKTRQKLDHQNESLEQHRRERETQTAALHTAEATLAEARRRLDSDGEALATQKADLATALAPYGLSVPASVREATTHRTTLRQRASSWQQRADRLRDLGHQRDIEQEKQRHLSAQAATLDQQQAEHDARLRLSTEALAEVERERHALFADRSPDAEEQRGQQALAAAEKAVETCRQAAFAVQKSIDENRTRQDDLDQRLRHRAQDLTQRQETLHQARAGLGFADEDDWRAALFLEDQRQHVSTTVRACEDRLREARAVHDRQKTELKNEHEKALSDETAEDLRQRLITEQEAQKARLQQIGALQQRLDEDSRQRAQKADLLRRRDAQEEIYQQWLLLNELIGSAKGDKYSKFVQSLLFGQLIEQANRQLRQMSPRYQLAQGTGDGLQIDVIDAFQNSDRRTSQNLSGGETFLISLALALGLSQMSSLTVRVDSLFLDEGFGTLDEDSLMTALDTLGRLHQHGKMIGIISHVAALKERLSVRIDIYPSQINGFSKIKGPGCSATWALREAASRS